MRVADWIISRLADEGIRHIFLLPGGGAMYLNDALACERRITPVPCHHEQACGIAAEAYGRTGHKDNPGFGVALVTTGPGATNVITPVAGAWIDSIPMLIISGQVKRSDRIAGRPLRQGGVQEVDIMPMVNGITKYATTLDDPQQVRIEFEKALQKMLSGRPGPVWLEIPLDVQGAQIPPEMHLEVLDKTNNVCPPDAEQTRRVLDLLAQAERPLIFAGHGVRLSGAVDAFRQLVDAWRIPVVCTWNALDLIHHEHPLYVGSPGVVALRAPNFAIQNCDLLIAIGCRLDNVTTAYNPENFARVARKVVVDIDSAELNKTGMEINEKVNCCAKQVIDSWLSEEIPSDIDRSSWLMRCSNWKKRFAVNDCKPFKKTDSISHYQFVDALSEIMPENTLIATGSSGLAIESFYSTFRTKKDQRVFLTSGLGSMGYGLSAAIGACLGNGSQKTVAVESDGSLMLNLQEFATLKGLDLPITLIVMDNQGYASIRNTQRNYFDGRFIATGSNSGLHMPDLGAIANSFGIPIISIDSVEQMKPDLHHALQSKGPLICRVCLSPDESLWPKVSAIPQKDGTMMSMPLEDMSPLLTLDEFKDQMIIPILESSLKARQEN